jgi:CRP/FNR family transcriptional regulator, cyclic AMP receptor protein
MLMIDVTGYVAAALVLAAFCMSSMTALRVLAILSNVAFIAYAHCQGLMPILILHMILLPVNIGRLSQMRSTALTATLPPKLAVSVEPE